MDRISGYSQVSEIISFDYSQPFLLFPVRHHSPVCSWQLIRAIKEYQPDVILIEGPENANDMIGVLTDERTKLPAAFYYYYKDRKKLISDEAEDYKCYYPFIYASPEYNALKTAAAMDIEARFIDLPYSEILITTAVNKGLRSNKDKHSYTDDSRLIYSKFCKKLCEKTDLRTFEEFWEKYFEIEGLRLSVQDFVQQMYTYCIITRNDETENDLAADGTLARENHMALRIKEALKDNKKVLAVTGGFHSLGIYELLKSDNIQKEKLHKLSQKDEGCFPVAYSYEAADALSGYASGIQRPYFYDCVMNKLIHCDDPAGVYSDTVLDLLIGTVRACDKHDIQVSMADASAAQSMMSGLAALRGCHECGLYELEDAVTSSFIKGEKTISSALPIDLMHKLATGDKTGHIGDINHVPPLIADFEKQCKRFRLKIKTVTPNKTEVSLFTTANGMELSRFFHRMVFLGTDFAQRTKGPDLHRRKDRSRVREEWVYKKVPATDVALIDHTADGFTIEEACRTCASRTLRHEKHCDVAAHILVDCFQMGLELSDNDKACAENILNSDGDFFSVGRGLRHFITLMELQQLYNTEFSAAENCAKRCMTRIITALPDMASVKDDHIAECAAIMYAIQKAVTDGFREYRQDYENALLSLCGKSDKDPFVYGTALGILYAFDPHRRKLAEQAMSSYLKGDRNVQIQGAEFLHGLFNAARDIIMTDDSFIRMTDTLICGLDYDDFIEILPSMKLAFSCFTPYEIQQTATAVAKLYDADSAELLVEKPINERLYSFGEKIDKEIVKLLSEEEKP